MSNLFILILGTCIVAIIGYKFKSLTISGAVGTVIVGSFVSIGFGIAGLIILGVFFASSSLWSKLKSGNKRSLQQKVEKGEQRDIIQVFANGGVAAVASLLYFLFSSNIFLFIFIGAIAVATADTWASEIGTLSKRKPILLTKLKRVDAGTSGAVSLLGTIAGFIGALLICICAFILWSELTVNYLILLTIVGFFGNVLDTILGAYIQVVYRCPICKIETEKIRHCSTKTNYLRGISFCNNDVVNFLSIFITSAIGGILIHLYG